jgi:hypothetical protein
METRTVCARERALLQIISWKYNVLGFRFVVTAEELSAMGRLLLDKEQPLLFLWRSKVIPCWM